MAEFERRQFEQGQFQSGQFSQGEFASNEFAKNEFAQNQFARSQFRRNSIQERRFAQARQQVGTFERRVFERRQFVIGDRDDRTGQWEAIDYLGGVQYGEKIFNAAAVGQPVRVLGGTLDDLSVDEAQQEAALFLEAGNCLGYLQGQVFNCEEEPPRPSIKWACCWMQVFTDVLTEPDLFKQKTTYSVWFLQKGMQEPIVIWTDTTFRFGGPGSTREILEVRNDVDAIQAGSAVAPSFHILPDGSVFFDIQATYRRGTGENFEGWRIESNRYLYRGGVLSLVSTYGYSEDFDNVTPDRYAPWTLPNIAEPESPYAPYLMNNIRVWLVARSQQEQDLSGDGFEVVSTAYPSAYWGNAIQRFVRSPDPVANPPFPEPPEGFIWRAFDPEGETPERVGSANSYAARIITTDPNKRTALIVTGNNYPFLLDTAPITGTLVAVYEIETNYNPLADLINAGGGTLEAWKIKNYATPAIASATVNTDPIFGSIIPGQRLATQAFTPTTAPAFFETFSTEGSQGDQVVYRDGLRVFGLRLKVRVREQ